MQTNTDPDQKTLEKTERKKNREILSTGGWDYWRVHIYREKGEGCYPIMLLLALPMMHLAMSHILSRCYIACQWQYGVRIPDSFVIKQFHLRDIVYYSTFNPKID